MPAAFRIPTPPCAAPAPMRPPTRAWDELTGSPIRIVMRFQRMAESRAAIMTLSVMAAGSTIPLPMVLATAVVRNAPRMFMNAASVTAAPGDRTLVETTVAIAFAQSCQPLATSNRTARTMIRIRISGMFQDDPFENIGDVFRAVRGIFEELVDVLPFDDVDGVVVPFRRLPRASRYLRSMRFSRRLISMQCS